MLLVRNSRRAFRPATRPPADGTGSGSVSYTHLDVYKRQNFFPGVREKPFSGTESGAPDDAGQIAVNHKAVSYTHLDVYKRQGRLHAPIRRVFLTALQSGRPPRQ